MKFHFRKTVESLLNVNAFYWNRTTSAWISTIQRVEILHFIDQKQALTHIRAIKKPGNLPGFPYN